MTIVTTEVATITTIIGMNLTMKRKRLVNGNVTTMVTQLFFFLGIKLNFLFFNSTEFLRSDTADVAEVINLECNESRQETFELLEAIMSTHCRISSLHDLHTDTTNIITKLNDGELYI